MASPSQRARHYLSIGFDQWEKFFNFTKPHDSIQDEAREADHLAIRAAMVATYLEARGASGCGDSGHDRALEEAKAVERKIRNYLASRRRLAMNHGRRERVMCVDGPDV